jgi:2,4-dienoyl-CoA reductase-like NADH-dependent reductase (Old Yellow Enzyme family)/thioredoxin reductase
MTDNSYILQPGKIGGITIKNRIVMPAMGTNYVSHNGQVTRQMIDYYCERAGGGPGLVIVEVACVDSPVGRVGDRQLLISDDSHIPGLKELASAIQKEGARAAIQLHHAGGATTIAAAGQQPVAPSPIPRMPSADQPRELTVAEIKILTSRFASAALRAKEAGFDGVEIHAAHVYLLAQFLSSRYNQRQDEYGGSLENRARFFLEVVRSVREAVGKDYPVWCRLNGTESGKGITVEDAVITSKMAVSAGVDAINLSAEPPIRSSYFQDGWGLSMVTEVKKAVSVPVFAVGRLNLNMGNDAIRDGIADFICIGRQFITDPEFISKTLNRQAGDIRPCLHCNICIVEHVMEGKKLECTVNSSVGKEKDHRLLQAIEPKRVLIVGGGPAGMEAARIAAMRGHDIILYEKNNSLGGQLLVAALPPHKTEIKLLKDYLIRQLDKPNIHIRLGAEFSSYILDREKPDVVVFATGSVPATPSIKGLETVKTHFAANVLSDNTGIEREVVIIGGGSAGCETAVFLAQRGHSVTIIELLSEPARDLNLSLRLPLLNSLSSNNVNILTGSKINEIFPDGRINISRDNTQIDIKADSIILSAGVEPNNKTAVALHDKLPEYYIVGDARRPSRIKEAITDGNYVGRII